MKLRYRSVAENILSEAWLLESFQHWRGVSCLALLSVFAIVSGCTGCGNAGSAQDVMAKVNGYKVLRSEVDKSYNAQIAGSPQKPTAAEEETLRLNILDQIIGV